MTKLFVSLESSIFQILVLILLLQAQTFCLFNEKSASELIYPKPASSAPGIVKVAWGINANAGEFPHQVALFVRKTKFFFFTSESNFCGGTIIGPQHILTAAHCLDDVAENEIFVVAGEVALKDFRKSSSAQTKDVHAKWVHQNWKGAQSFTPYDVAVLILKSNFTFTDYVRPAALEDSELPTGLNLWVAGWGITEENSDSGSQILKKVQVPVANSTFCEGFGYAFDRQNELCAGNGRYDACSGDSGGPLGHFRPNSNAFTVSGIVSWGPNAKCGTLGSYGAYANVKTFKSWIEPYLNEVYVSGAFSPSKTLFSVYVLCFISYAMIHFL